MSIQSAQKLNQSLYSEGKKNPIKNKTKSKKVTPSQPQISPQLFSCDQNHSLLSIQAQRISENLMMDKCITSQTKKDSIEKNKYNGNDFKKEEGKTNQQTQQNINTRRLLCKDSKDVNQVSHCYYLKKYQEKTSPVLNNQHQNEDTLNSCHELAIQGNANLPSLVDQKKSISREEHQAYTLDSKLTQRQQYNEDCKLIKKYANIDNNQLRFKTTHTYQNLKLTNKYVQQGKYFYKLENPMIKKGFWGRSSQQNNLKKLNIVSFNICAMLDITAQEINPKFCVYQGDRIGQIMEQIQQMMESGLDFIFLQQVCSKLSRRQLFNLLKRFNQRSKVKYYFPKNLENNFFFKTTIILTKHQGQFGQFSFSIPNKKSINQTQLDLSQQCFFVFTTKINGKDQKICLFNCHLKANNGFYSKELRQIRLRQIDHINHFKLKYQGLFFCIGDTNIGSTDQYKWEKQYASKFFFDAVNYKLSQERGSFLFLNSNNQVIDQKFDKVWIDKNTSHKTSVKIQYEDTLLKSCQGYRFNRQNLLRRVDGIVQYKSISDHSRLNAQIVLK